MLYVGRMSESMSGDQIDTILPVKLFRRFTRDNHLVIQYESINLQKNIRDLTNDYTPEQLRNQFGLDIMRNYYTYTSIAPFSTSNAKDINQQIKANAYTSLRVIPKKEEVLATPDLQIEAFFTRIQELFGSSLSEDIKQTIYALATQTTSAYCLAVPIHRILNNKYSLREAPTATSNSYNVYIEANKSITFVLKRRFELNQISEILPHGICNSIISFTIFPKSENPGYFVSDSIFDLGELEIIRSYDKILIEFARRFKQPISVATAEGASFFNKTFGGKKAANSLHTSFSTCMKYYANGLIPVLTLRMSEVISSIVPLSPDDRSILETLEKALDSYKTIELPKTRSMLLQSKEDRSFIYFQKCITAFADPAECNYFNRLQNLLRNEVSKVRGQKVEGESFQVRATNNRANHYNEIINYIKNVTELDVPYGLRSTNLLVSAPSGQQPTQYYTLDGKGPFTVNSIDYIEPEGSKYILYRRTGNSSASTPERIAEVVLTPPSVSRVFPEHNTVINSSTSTPERIAEVVLTPPSASRVFPEHNTVDNSTALLQRYDQLYAELARRVLFPIKSTFSAGSGGKLKATKFEPTYKDCMTLIMNAIVQMREKRKKLSPSLESSLQAVLDSSELPTKFAVYPLSAPVELPSYLQQCMNTIKELRASKLCNAFQRITDLLQDKTTSKSIHPSIQNKTGELLAQTEKFLKEEDMLEIIFVRHSVSCENIRTPVQKLDLAFRRKDPELAKTGIHHAIRAGSLLRSTLSFYNKTPMIGASVLLRTQQTADLMMNPTDPIYIIPYISEIPSADPGNQPLTRPEQTEFYTTYMPDILPKLNYTYIDKISDATTPSFEKFLPFLGTHWNTFQSRGLLLFSHGGVIKQMYESLDGTHPKVLQCDAHLARFKRSEGRVTLTSIESYLPSGVTISNGEKSDYNFKPNICLNADTPMSNEDRMSMYRTLLATPPPAFNASRLTVNSGPAGPPVSSASAPSNDFNNMAFYTKQVSRKRSTRKRRVQRKKTRKARF